MPPLLCTVPLVQAAVVANRAAADRRRLADRLFVEVPSELIGLWAEQARQVELHELHFVSQTRRARQLADEEFQQGRVMAERNHARVAGKIVIDDPFFRPILSVVEAGPNRHLLPHARIIRVVRGGEDERVRIEANQRTLDARHRQRVVILHVGPGDAAVVAE